MGEKEDLKRNIEAALRIRCKEYLDAKGGFCMYNRRRIRCLLGIFCIVVGILIILRMILPAGFWWFILGVALIAAGVWCVRC